HVKNRRGSAVITIALADAHPNLNLIPGNRLCQACRRNCFELKKRPTFQAPPPPLASDAPSEHDDPEVALESVNEALAAVGESPLQRKRGRTSRETYAQKKVRKLKITAERRIYTSLGVQQKPTSQPNQDEDFVLSDYVSLMQDVKNKFDLEKNREKKLQLLTLAPPSWSREKIMNFFVASERQALQAVKVRSESGILGTVPKRRGRPVSEEVKASIMEFYQDDAVSYCLPGKKDVLRGRQKRLLLLNLKEMHEE
ncbi:unnamed protein product, partial [Ixodes pacificus]